MTLFNLFTRVVIDDLRGNTMSESNPGTKPSTEGKSFLNSLKSEDAQKSAPEPKRSPAPAPAGSRSVIGHNIQFRGELIGTEDLHIEGRIEGTVIMKGQNLSIGEQGELDANIHAQNIVINGKLTGDVLADELIEIKNTAIVKGNLIAPRIQLEDGGKFRGSMDMVDTDEEQAERRDAFKEKLVHPDLPNKKTAVAPKKPDTAVVKNDAKPGVPTKPNEGKNPNKPS
jgi:cytoskeletal protein CcmA (bactofilin family)